MKRSTCILLSTLLTTLLTALLPALALAQSGPTRPEAKESGDALSAIHRECLRAWPPDLLYDLTGAEKIPAKALSHSEAQMELFTETIDTAQGMFFPSDLTELRDAFQQYIQPGTRFLDLGSGDGRAVFYAASLGADAVGYESEPRLFEASRRAQEALSRVVSPESARIVRGDYYSISWSDYDVIFYYDLGSDDALRLRQKIFSELAPGAVFLVAHGQIPFPGLTPEGAFEAITAYRMPEKLDAVGPEFVEVCEREVESLHRFLQDWFNGHVASTDNALRRFSDVLVPSFQIVSADGSTTHRKAAIDVVRGAHGMWQGRKGKITIKNFNARVITGYTVVATYEEWHQVGDVRQGFKTTAALQMRWGHVEGVEWLHLHQTALP